MRCPNCGHEMPEQSAPPEPPIGTWVKNRHGAVSVRIRDVNGTDGWAPAPFGFYAAARWEAMWDVRGPLVECGPYGKDLP